MSDKKDGFSFKKFWLPLFLFAIAVIIFYKVVDRLPDVFSGILDLIGIISPFLWGLVIAFILYRPSFVLEKALQRTNAKVIKCHSRGLAVAICYVTLFLIIAGVLYLLLPQIFKSVASLVNKWPEYYESAIKYISSIADNDGKIFGFNIIEFLNAFSVTDLLNLDTVTQYAGEVFKATGAILDVLMAFVVSVYVLLGRGHLMQVGGKILRMVLPKKRINFLHRYMLNAFKICYSYIYSQLIDAVVVSALCFAVFAIIGVPYSLLLALFMGFCNLIPYFGALIGGAVVVVITLVSTGELITSIIALACIIVVQQVDANVIQPRIVADSVGLRPIYVLLAIMIGSGLFGFLGILVSVPLMAIIRMLIVDYIEELGDDDTLLVKKQKELSSDKE